MLTMWVTDDEHRRLLERCQGKQLAAWMRQVCLDERPARIGRLPTLSPALLRQLAGMGNNLNQIARWVNAGQGSYSRITCKGWTTGRTPSRNGGRCLVLCNGRTRG